MVLKQTGKKKDGSGFQNKIDLMWNHYDGESMWNERQEEDLDFVSILLLTSKP